MKIRNSTESESKRKNKNVRGKIRRKLFNNIVEREYLIQVVETSCAPFKIYEDINSDVSEIRSDPDSSKDVMMFPSTDTFMTSTPKKIEESAKAPDHYSILAEK